MAKAKKKNYIYAVGRRRSASARVRLHKGAEESMVNDMLIGKYFPGKIMSAQWMRPFELTETTGKYYVTARILGGGKNGQLDALVNGMAKAFAQVKEDYKLILKTNGLLTRDARIRERRKVGTGGKARRAKQSPKR